MTIPLLASPGEMPEAESQMELPPPGRYGFVGRDAELRRLEKALTEHPIVFLTGDEGVGKTALACELARRVSAQGPEHRVFYTSFAQGVGLPRAVHEMGTSVMGIEFAQLSFQHQRQWVLDYLSQQPCLFIWDDLDTAPESKGDATPLFGSEERRELGEFLGEVNVAIASSSPSSNKSSVLTIGHQKEEWLDIEHGVEVLDGLEDSDAIRLAELIMEGAGVTPGKVAADNSELLQLLEGNPLAMMAVLPHLKYHTLRGVVRTLHKIGNGGTLGLEGCLTYALSNTSVRTRKHLLFMGLFSQRVLLDVLTFISQEGVYSSVMSGEMGWGAWRSTLREGRDGGLLESISPSVYQMHLAQERFLEGRLGTLLSSKGLKQLEEEFLRVYTDLGDYFVEKVMSSSSHDVDATVTGVLAEEPNLLRALQLAEQWGQWHQAQLLIQPLSQVYMMQQRHEEMRRLRGSLLQKIGLGAAEANAKGAVELWLYLRGGEGSDATDRSQWDKANEIYSDILGCLESLSVDNAEAKMGAVYHQLGVIAQGRQQHDKAVGWYGKALGIWERRGDKDEAADEYQQLGIIALAGGLYDDAKQWLLKALLIREDVGERKEDEESEEVAAIYYQLGQTAQFKGDTDDAQQWYNKASSAFERLGDEVNVADVYYRQAMLAQRENNHGRAKILYDRALGSFQRLGDRASEANGCYQMGLIDQAGLLYEDALVWYQTSLKLREGLNDKKGEAQVYRQMGLVAREQKDYEAAERWFGKALETYRSFDDGEDKESVVSTLGHLALMEEEQDNYPNALEYVAFAHQIAESNGLPQLPRVKAHLARLREKMGEDAYEEHWNRIIPSEGQPEGGE